MPADEKKHFLIATANDAKAAWMEEKIIKMIARASTFRAKDGREALEKLQNFPPHVLITDLDLPKISGPKLVDHACNIKAASNTAVLIVGTMAPENTNVDEVVSGKLHFFTTEGNEAEFKDCLTKALNFSGSAPGEDFRLRTIKNGEVLLKEGDRADYVYFVKKGKLVATKAVEGKNVVLGNVEYGEFVGEMAYINGEARNATVTALTDCELIQVPINRFDKVLYAQPNWSKALMMTLTKRVSALNAGKKNG